MDKTSEEFNVEETEGKGIRGIIILSLILFAVLNGLALLTFFSFGFVLNRWDILLSASFWEEWIVKSICIVVIGVSIGAIMYALTDNTY